MVEDLAGVVSLLLGVVFDSTTEAAGMLGGSAVWRRSQYLGDRALLQLAKENRTDTSRLGIADRVRESAILEAAERPLTNVG